MEEVLEIEQQAPLQEEPPKRKLYNSIVKNKLYSKSYEEFEKQYSTPESIDKIYNAVSSKKLYSKSKDEFQKQYFQVEQPASKKKVGTVSFGETYSSPELDSEAPSTSKIPEVVDYGDGELLPNNAVDLSKKATEYSKKTKEIEKTDMMGNPIPETVPDEAFIATGKKIIEDLDKQGIKEDFVNAISDLPDEAFNDPTTSKEALVDLYKTNKIKFHQILNEQKNRIAIRKGAIEKQKNSNNGINDIDPKQMGIHTGNQYLGTNEEQNPQSFQDLQNIIGKKQSIIDQNLTGEERVKAQQRLKETYSAYINPTDHDLMAEYEQSSLKGKVDATQYAGLKTLQLFEPDKYKQALNILNTDIEKQYTFRPEFENFQSPVAASPSVTTSDSTLAAKNKGSLSSETIDQQIGKESILRQLTTLGRDNVVTQINSQQYELEKAFNSTNNVEEKEAIKQQYVANQEKLNEVKNNALQDKVKFPLTSKLQFDNQVKELTQDAGMGAVEYGTNRFIHGVGTGVESFEDMAASLFGSDKDKALLGMRRLGEGKWFESKTYLPEDYKSTGSPVIMKASKKLKDEAKKIMGDKSLNDLSQEQKQKLTDLVANNQDQIETVTNPEAGKSKNFFSKSTLYSNAGFIGDVGSFMYKIMGAKSLGLSGKSAELITLYNDGYSAAYNQALSEGKSASAANEYGVVHGGIMLLAGTVSSKFDAVKDMLAASKSPVSKQILGLGEAGWDAIVNKNKGTISKIANGVADVAKSNAKMIGTYGVGVSIANDLADKGFFNKDISFDEAADNVKHSAVDMAIGSVGLAGIGFIAHAMKNPVTLLDKATIWEIGDNPELSKIRIDESVAKNELTQADGDAKKKAIDNVSSLIGKVPTENSKGKPLTDKQRVEYLYNSILKEKGKEAAKDLPDNQSEKAEHIALVADHANALIYEPKTDKQLETRLSQIEKELTPEKKDDGTVVPINENLKKDLLAEQEAINNQIEFNKRYEKITKPEITETTEGTGGENPPTGTTVISEGDGGIGGITQAANAVRRQSLNEPEFQKNPQSFLEWTNEAERLLKEGYDVEALMNRLEKDPDATPVENAIRKIYIATLDAEIAKNPTDALLAKQKRFAQIGDVVNREAGQKLVSLKGQGNPLNTISDFYVAAMEADGVDKLTDAQKLEVQKDYAEVKAARDKAEAVAKEATAKFEEMKAENELLRKQLESKGKKTEMVFTNGERDFVAEIKNYKDELKKLADEYKAAGQKLGIASDGGGESFVISAKMAKVIMKIAQVHVEQVGVKIAEVTKRTWDEVKDIFDGITENDIRDVFAGKYNEKKLTQPEIKAQMRELQTESKLLIEYENLLKGGKSKNEAREQKRNERLTAIRKQIDKLNKDREEGKYSDEAIAKRMIESNKRKQAEFERQLREGDFEKKKQPISLYDSPEFRRKNPKLYKELLDSQNEAHNKQLEVERKLIEKEMKGWGLGTKFREAVKKAGGTLKHLFASFDASAIAVQNLPFIVNNPVIGIKGIGHSFKDFASQKEFDRYLTQLHNSPDWHIIKDSGLRVTEPKSLLDSGREDFFPERFKAVVKIKGKYYGYVKIKGGKYELLDISKPFERQFTSLGNWLRVVKFRTEAEKLYEKGFTYEKNPEEFKTLAKRLNNLSSSSDIPEAYQNQVTRAMIWSTRLIAAKLNMLGISDVASLLPFTGVKKGYYRGLGIKGQKLSRQQAYAAADLAKFATSVVVGTYLYAMARGGKVNTNVDSNGFLDVEYGDGKSANFTGGFSRYISLLFQLYNAGKTDKSGTFNPYADKGTDRLKEVVNFVRGKAPPMTASGMNLLAGKNMANMETDAATEAAKYKMPLALGQIKDQIDRDGYSALFTEGLMTFIGFNAKDQREYIDQDITIPEIKFMADKGVKIMPYKKESLKPLTQDGKPIEVTPEKYDEFIKKREEYIMKDVRDLMAGKKHILEGTDTVENEDGQQEEKQKWSILSQSEVDKITTDELKGFVMTATTRANEKAIHDVFKGRGNELKNSGKRKIE